MSTLDRPVTRGPRAVAEAASIDQVARMKDILKRVRAGEPSDLRWVLPPRGTPVHLLIWTEGGEEKQHPEDDLRRLADWAEKKWLIPHGAHAALIVPGSAYSVTGPNSGRPANLGWPAHYPMTAICTICGYVVERERMDPDQLDWLHTDRKAGEAPPGAR